MIDATAIPSKSEVRSGKESSTKKRHVQLAYSIHLRTPHLRERTTIAPINAFFDGDTAFTVENIDFHSQSPPSRVSRVAFYETHTSVRGPSSAQKCKGICLPIASFQSPLARALNNGRSLLGCTTIPVKSKTIRAATEICKIASAVGLAI